jgi:hypothetical protein
LVLALGVAGKALRLPQRVGERIAALVEQIPAAYKPLVGGAIAGLCRLCRGLLTGETRVEVAQALASGILHKRVLLAKALVRQLAACLVSLVDQVAGGAIALVEQLPSIVDPRLSQLSRGAERIGDVANALVIDVPLGLVVGCAVPVL